LYFGSTIEAYLGEVKNGGLLTLFWNINFILGFDFENRKHNIIKKDRKKKDNEKTSVFL